MLYLIEEIKQEEIEQEEQIYTKDDKFYKLVSCHEFIPAKNKAIADYGWKQFETKEQAIEYFGLKKVISEE